MLVLLEKSSAKVEEFYLELKKNKMGHVRACDVFGGSWEVQKGCHVIIRKICRKRLQRNFLYFNRRLRINSL